MVKLQLPKLATRVRFPSPAFFDALHSGLAFNPRRLRLRRRDSKLAGFFDALRNGPAFNPRRLRLRRRDSKLAGFF